MKPSWPGVWKDERGGWCRFGLILTLVLGGAILGILLSFAALPESSRAIQENTANPESVKDLTRLVAGLLPKVLALVGLLVGVRFVHRKPLGCIFTDGRPFRFRFAAQSALVWVVLWSLAMLARPHGWERLAQRAGQVSLAWWPVLAVVLLGASTVAIILEETLFRGYLLIRLTAWLSGPWLALGITALLFAGIHLHAGGAAYVALVFMGVLLGVAGLRAGTLAPLLGMHAANNWLQALCCPSDTNMDTTNLDAVAFVAGLLIWFGWLLWVTRKRPAPTLAQPDGAANGRQPFRSEANTSSVAAASRR